VGEVAQGILDAVKAKIQDHLPNSYIEVLQKW
jgi:hypothetical protein